MLRDGFARNDIFAIAVFSSILIDLSPDFSPGYFINRILYFSMIEIFDSKILNSDGRRSDKISKKGSSFRRNSENF